MASKIDRKAEEGFSNASSYDQHRPSYPPEAVQKLLEHLGVLGVRNARILDLAAGTGKFTSLLAAREEEFEIVAVEPHDEMRAVLAQKGLRGVRVVDGTATHMRAVESGWADAVTCAQAFHWFATMDALREIHRTLAPGSSLGLIWNFDDYNARIDWKPSTIWEGKVREVIASCTDKDRILKHSEWPSVFDEQLKTTPATILSTESADPLFSLPLGEETFKWTIWLSKDDIWDRIRTISHMAILEGQQLEDAKLKVYNTMGGDDVETNEKGEVAMHGQTLSYWTTAIPGAPLKNGG